jgi:hypothetical protein
MDLVTIALRIVHIVSGVAWAGGAALFLGFVAPSLAGLGDRSSDFLDELVRRRRLGVYFAVVSTLTVLAGAILYWRDTNGLTPSIVSSSFGLGFGIGGIAGFLAWLVAVFVIPQRVRTLGARAAELRALDGQPSNGARDRYGAELRQVRVAGAGLLGLLAFALVMMASARYL